jgi:tRNA-Thr(GGU) m(6)t(6)A37 methyltransferase TsaA
MAGSDPRVGRPLRRGSVGFAAAVELVAIGQVRSPLTDRHTAPKQGDEGAPDAELVFEDGVVAGLDGIAAGDEILVLTWLDRAARDVLRVRPRGDLAARYKGVFATRSPDRPNPIGLHRVTVRRVDGPRVTVSGLEALDGTPIVDVKPLLRTVDER